MTCVITPTHFASALWDRIYCYDGLLLFSYCYFRASTGFFCFQTGFLLFQTGFHGLPDQEMDLVSYTSFHWDMEARRSPFETKGSPWWNNRSPWKPENNNRRTIEARDNNRFELRDWLIEMSKRKILRYILREFQGQQLLITCLTGSGLDCRSFQISGFYCLPIVIFGLPRASFVFIRASFCFIRASTGFEIERWIWFLILYSNEIWKPEESRLKQREARRETKEARGSPKITIGEQ